MRRLFAALTLALALAAPTAAQPVESYAYSGFATVQKGSTLYIFGGVISRIGKPPSTMNAKLDLETGRLTTLSADRRFSRWPAAALIGNKVYVSGGLSTSYRVAPGGGAAMGWSDQFAVYDLETDRWTSLPSLKRPLTNHCAFAAEGSVYLLGGTIGGAGVFRKPAPNADVLVYSIAQRVWATRRGLGHRLTDYASCVQIGDEFVLIGGSNGRVIDGQVWGWNFRTGAWRRWPDLPNRLMSTAAAVTPDGTVLVTGGAVGTDKGVLIDASRDIWALTPGAETWRSVGTVPEGRANHGMALVGGRAWLLGGSAGGEFRRETVNPPKGMWLEGVTPRSPAMR